MNYYEHHMGDYLKATAHLSALEDCFYRRALDWYYSNERPLPAEVAQCARLLRAAGPSERKAVAAILEEFFTLEEDGWHNKRADEEIAAYNDAAPEREAKKSNAADRKRRSRERRAQLFDQLRERGVVPSYDTPTAELVTLLSRVTGRGQDAPGTATHFPPPSTQEESLRSESNTSDQGTGTVAGLVCARLKREAGMVHVNPSDTRLQAALDIGVSADALVAIAKDFPGKPLAYVISTAVGRHRDAAGLAAGETHGASGAGTVVRHLSVVDRIDRAAAAAGIDLSEPGAGGRVIDA